MLLLAYKSPVNEKFSPVPACVKRFNISGDRNQKPEITHQPNLQSFKLQRVENRPIQGGFMSRLNMETLMSRGLKNRRRTICVSF